MSDDYDAMIRDALKKAQDKYGLGGGDDCFAIVKAQIETESNFDPKAENKKSHARGLLQLLKAAAAQMGYPYDDLWDPAKNIECGVLYLAWCMSQFDGDCSKGIAAYFTGVGRLKKADGDVEKLPQKKAGNRRDTRAYVSKIRERAKQYMKTPGDKKATEPAQPEADGDSVDGDKLVDVGKELDRLGKKTELLEKWITLEAGATGARKKALEGLVDKLLKEMQAELDLLHPDGDDDGRPGSDTVPAPDPKGGDKGKPGGK